ncbi:pentaxin family domain-containing protein [Phthorimaea operculella]|nr:pentaxin family domain-containing protein [Phthorimaea operculella]
MIFVTALLATASLLSAAAAINRPVYKVILTQKGFTQFVQYDVETPPIREFTLCVWVKFYTVNKEQSIFTYIVNGNKRVVRLWLDSGGYHLMVLFNEHEVSRVPVDLSVDTWRHICLSYQADFGAWALYLDSRLISCEASQALQYFVIPGGGSIILGYGTTEQGSSIGMEGEIFGANMILTSTIIRNHTIQGHPQYVQKTFQRNKIRPSKNIDYVVLDNLDTDESHNVAKGTKLPPKSNKSISFIKVQTPFSYVKHTVGANSVTMLPTRTISTSESHETDMFELVMDNKQRPSKAKSVNHHVPLEKFKVTPGNELSGADTHDFAMLSELETPPPLHSTRSNYLEQNLQPEKVTQSFQNNNDANHVRGYKQKSYFNDLPDKELPPPPGNDKNVYGQWTSSKYAGNVLNYLKRINYYHFNNNKNYKVPPTIPLTKTSNDYPYPSRFNTKVLRPPSIQKKSWFADKHLHGQYQPVPVRRMHRKKREVRQPEINVKIVKEDIRSEILSSHARTRPVDVDIIHRGKTQKRMVKNEDNHRLPRNNDDIHNQFYHGSMFNELPFLKSFEYFTGIGEGNYNSSSNKHSEDMYAKSFSTANKWHNIKTYNNDYTPRRMPGVDSEHEQTMPHPAIRLKYVPENHKITQENNDESMIQGRKLAKGISDHSDGSHGKVSILKYNHGFLPGHSQSSNNKQSNSEVPHQRNAENFHKHVKLGNALDERKIISNNEEIKKHSFLGGDEKVPDINRNTPFAQGCRIKAISFFSLIGVCGNIVTLPSWEGGQVGFAENEATASILGRVGRVI